MNTSLVGTLEFAKFLITIFVMCYAYYFLRRTDSDYERKPWEYLYVAFMFLFIVELISSLQIFRASDYTHDFFTQLKSFAEFGFLSFLLFAVISQHYVLLKLKKIVIEEKPTKTIFDSIKEKFLFYEKEIKEELSEDEEVSPEEALEEELKDLDDNTELEEQEDELRKVIGDD